MLRGRVTAGVGDHLRHEMIAVVNAGHCTTYAADVRGPAERVIIDCMPDALCSWAMTARHWCVAVAFGACVAPAASCTAPTEITLHITTNVACSVVEAQGISVAAGDEASIRDRPPAMQTGRCTPGPSGSNEVGHLVIVPSGAREAPISLRVVAGVDAPVATCTAENHYQGCIVSRFLLPFVPHQNLNLEVQLVATCKDVSCDDLTTCVHGVCVSARVDPDACSVPGGCAPDERPDGGDDGRTAPDAHDSAPVQDSAVHEGCIALPRGAVSFWRGEADARDALHTNDGAWTGSPRYAAGKVGMAFVLDGASEISAPSRRLPVGAADRTVELWARIDSLRLMPNVANQTLGGYGVEATGENFRLVMDADKKLALNGWFVDATGPLAEVGRWYHLAAINDARGQHLYVDGVLAAENPTALSTPAGTAFVVGLGLTGLVDEVTAYDRALSVSEIAAIVAAGSRGKCP